MSEPFIAEIRIFGFNFPPRGFAQCDGQLLAINQFQSLYSLLGTTYGGDGRTNFALPDLRGRAPMHVGSGRTLGQKSGQEQVALADAQMPAHSHSAYASSDTGATPIPSSSVLLAGSAPNELYHSPAELVDLKAGTIANAGGGQAHNNMQPSHAVNFCIALTGLFPPRN